MSMPTNERPTPPTSRLAGFYRSDLPTRWRVLAEQLGLAPDDLGALDQNGLTVELADHMIENAIGVFGMPLGLALNFVVNGREVLVPMAIEEPSVVAGASYMAKLVREGGGFTASADEPLMIGQIQVLGVEDLRAATQGLLDRKQELLSQADAASPGIVEYGGGARDLTVRVFESSPVGPMLVVHLAMDVRDAMGANTVNTAAEALAPAIETLTGGRAHLRILTNLADQRLARATCTVPAGALTFDEYPGEDVRDGIVEAWALAEVDPYRAATHNKGIMNGIDAVVIATGNDWRAIEAGAHAYAAHDGRYTSLSRWQVTPAGDLQGSLELPLAVGTIGGSTRSHPTAELSLAILGVKTGRELAEIVAAVGLAQNMAALRALATEGIQHGHMALHARQLALAAGATTAQADEVAQQMVDEGQIHLERARQLVASREVGDGSQPSAGP